MIPWIIVLHILIEIRLLLKIFKIINFKIIVKERKIITLKKIKVLIWMIEYLIIVL